MMRRLRPGMAAAVVLACAAWGVGFAAPRAEPAPGSPAAAPGAVRDGYRLALAPYTFRFPRDHASHPDYRTEWWYYTGQLATRRGAYGFQLTFFRVGIDTAWRSSRSQWAPRELVFAHAALTDIGRRRHVYDERIARPALGMAGADTASYHTWIGDWSAALASDGRTHRLRAALPARSGSPRRSGAGDTGGAHDDSIAFDLELAPVKPPAIHGAGGVSRKSAGVGNASHYYSFTRMTARGRLTVDRHTLDATGEAWMDHEFGTSELGPGQVGWDWFSLQLDDGRELMLYRLRLKDGRTEPQSSGTLVGRDGRTRALAVDAFQLDPLSTWRSARTGGVYPARWRVRVPSLGLDVELVPVVDDQELVTATTGGIAYWEGAVTVRGTGSGRPVKGRGYVELTGYAGAGLRF